jgi:ubiquitin-conjugating enzyme E2 J1
LEALISFLPTPADGAIGALDWSPAERKRLAQQSVQFVCKKCCNAGSGCHKVIDLLPKMDPEVAAAKAKKASAFAKEIAELQRLQQVNEVRRDGTTTTAAAAPDVDSCNTDRTDNNTEISNTDDKTSSRHNAQTNAEVVNHADIQSSPLPVSTTNALLQPPEEEIVFGADDGDVSDANGSDEDRNDGKMSTRPGPSATTTENDSLPQQATNSSMNDTTTNVEGNAADVDLDVGLEHANNVNNIENDDLTSLYDPLLNLMILLMVVICYLLVQKYMELQAELFELQQDDGVHDEL